jgi:pimeloyl-ACP methyl ester carboxylesterase
MVLVDPTSDREQIDAAAVRLPELESLPDTLDQARASRVPSGVPVFLIDAVSPLKVPFATQTIRTLRMSYRADLEGESLEHKKWLETVPGSRLIIAHYSGHNVAHEQPELVVATIREAVEEVGRRLQR